MQDPLFIDAVDIQKIPVTKIVNFEKPEDGQETADKDGGTTKRTQL